jgi:hypothetical protein
LTEFEKWQKDAQQQYKTKRRKAKHKQDAGVEDIMSYKGNKGKFDASGMSRHKSDMKDLINPVRNLAKDTMLNEEEWDISEYLDSKVEQNAKMTSRLQSTLKRFETQFGRTTQQGIISENNSSGENDD